MKLFEVKLFKNGAPYYGEGRAASGSVAAPDAVQAIKLFVREQNTGITAHHAAQVAEVATSNDLSLNQKTKLSAELSRKPNLFTVEDVKGVVYVQDVVVAE